MLNLLKLLPEYFIFIQSVSEFFIVGIPSNKSATAQILSTLEDDVTFYLFYEKVTYSNDLLM